MKNKITRFLLITSFLISTISCSVDEQEPSPSNLPIPVDLQLPPNTGFHQYTEQEKRQIRQQNLIGAYQDRQTRSLIIVTRNNVKYTSTLRQLNFTFPYTVKFSRLARPMLVLNTAYGNAPYYIICDNNNPTRIIGLKKVYDGAQFIKL